MGKAQRAKGARGEREACQALEEHLGGTWSRGYQARGGGREQADVASEAWPGLHVEVKRGKRPVLWAALEQARADAGGAVPVVLARRDRDEWVVLVALRDLAALQGGGK